MVLLICRWRSPGRRCRLALASLQWIPAGEDVCHRPLLKSSNLCLTVKSRIHVLLFGFIVNINLLTIITTVIDQDALLLWPSPVLFAISLLPILGIDHICQYRTDLTTSFNNHKPLFSPLFLSPCCIDLSLTPLPLPPLLSSGDNKRHIASCGWASAQTQPHYTFTCNNSPLILLFLRILAPSCVMWLWTTFLKKKRKTSSLKYFVIFQALSFVLWLDRWLEMLLSAVNGTIFILLSTLIVIICLIHKHGPLRRGSAQYIINLYCCCLDSESIIAALDMNCWILKDFANSLTFPLVPTLS